MRAFAASGIPIHPGYTAMISTNGLTPNPFGTSPYRRGMRGMRGCGCSSTSGCGCSPGMGAYDPGRAVYGPSRTTLGQNASLDQMIGNAFGWLSGMVQTNLPASAAVPPQYGSTGALTTQIMNLAPWVIGGYLVMKALK
jgi:hypothetical protein